MEYLPAYSGQKTVAIDRPDPATTGPWVYELRHTSFVTHKFVRPHISHLTMNSLLIEDVDHAALQDALWIWRRGVESIVDVVDPDPSIEGLKNWVQAEILPTHKLRIARVSNQIVGIIASNAESVCALYVQPDHQGMGIGSALLEEAKNDSAGSLWLFTFAKNSRARAFYANHGFAEVAFGFESHWKLEDVKLVWSRPTNAA